MALLLGSPAATHCQGFAMEAANEEGSVDPTTALLHHVTGVHNNVAMGLEALAYMKSNKLFPTYVLMQKIWNKARHLKEVNGFTGHSPI